MSDASGLGPRRLLPLGAAATVAFAAVGFVTGTRPLPARGRAAASSAGAAADRAPSYREIGDVRRGSNADMYATGLAPLRRDPPEGFPSATPTDDDRRRALEGRAARRAYDGAPPTIPHAIDQLAPPDCAACHVSGARVGGKVAPRMSHEWHASCTQCHVVGADPRPLGAAPEAPPNGFAGLPAPPRGDRAWTGAPPVIPHTTRMRTECTSCHGTSGPLGIRTPHPYRQSCQQCHAPSAELDQRPQAGADAGGPPQLPPRPPPHLAVVP